MWVVFSTGRFGQELASFETECEAHDYIMRKKEVTFNTGFKKKFIEKECCETCKHYCSGKGDLLLFCEKGMFEISSCYDDIDVSEMLCGEWEAR